jgi:hypothetical protein
VKVKGKDSIKMQRELREDIKQDGTSTCWPIAVGCLRERFQKLQVEGMEQQELSQEKNNEYSDLSDCSELLQ